MYRRRALVAVPVALALVAPAVPATAAGIFDVAAYGARPGDGIDDTAAFSAALGAAAAARGGTVRVSYGVYDVRPDRLGVGAGVTLAGAGPGTVLRSVDHGFNLVAVGGGATVSGLTVDGDDKVVRGVTVAVGATGVRLTDITVRSIAPPREPGATGYAVNATQSPAAIHVSGNTDGVLLDRVTVDGVRAGATASPNVQFTGAFEGANPTFGWRRHNANDYYLQETPRPSPWAWQAVTSPSPVRAGDKALRSELRREDRPVYGGNRSEVLLDPERPREEHWYGFSILLPRGGDEDYAADRSAEVLAQWHSSPDEWERNERISPPLALYTVNGTWEIRRLWDHRTWSSNASMEAAGQRETRSLGSYEADKGRWTDWAFHVRWGWLPEHRPLLEIYKNRRLVYRTTGPNTTNDVVGNYFKMGVYKWDWSDGRASDTTRRVVYHDEYRVDDASGSLDAVSPPVPPPPPGAWPYPVARGVLVSSAPGQTIPRNVTIRASAFRNVGPKDDGDCVVLQGNGAAVEPDANLVVTGNSFTGCAKRAVKIQSPGAAVTYNTVDNPFLGTNPYVLRPAGIDTTDMYAGVSVYASRVKVHGNRLSGVGSHYAGIDVNGNGVPLEDVTLTGNTVANGAASRIGPSSLIRVHSAVTRLAVQGNSMQYGTWGLRCDVPPTAPSYSGNTVRDTATPYLGCLPAPQVGSAQMLRAAGGDPLTITGTGFGATAEAFRDARITVTVDGRSVPVTWVDDTTLRVTAPPGRPGARPSLVLARGGVAAVPVPAPGRYAASVTLLSPTAVRLSGGVTGTVWGTGFRGSTGWRLDGAAVSALPLVATSAELSGLPAGIAVLSDTSAVVKLPAAPDADGDGRPDPGAYTLSFSPADGAPYLLTAGVRLVYG
ncbi:heparin lyase I family protein [Planomonospora sphaerica]|uniref:heparin lyase I family protein n=1 Tax=Planomonospora sphaerica TaxID=161355 RepID=UPI0012906684|nr:heparin lyase I family protein [Planomonospora sphaerica]